ncbi:hypothetical protein [Dysgonomonas sp. ZJ279]|uniref:hypothetical protein n=1 Tax=Dysgonomonas sp. ZJ279 TaxID=2709796 RepID=UPI0013EBFC0D|nr:hypothetical protein [Dysgonomonas sp. ZJ279]
MGNFADEHTLIIQNNLPSRRWKIRRIRTAYDKKLRCIDKEHTYIYNQIRNLGYEELVPPIQRGYKRLFVLTEEAKYSNHAEFYQNILDKINVVWYSPHKIFKEKKRKISKWKYRKNKEQKLQEPDGWTFQNMKFTDEEAKYFYKVEYYDYQLKQQREKYVFAEQWRFILRIVPNIITKVQIKDLELEQYRDELRDFLDRDRNRKRLVRMAGGNTYSWKKIINEKENRKKYMYNSLINIPIQQII